MRKRLSDDVQEIFRAMMPVFNNENKTVITPLLATGNQVRFVPRACTNDQSSVVKKLLKTNFSRSKLLSTTKIEINETLFLTEI